jgi:hypothetical protein
VNPDDGNVENGDESWCAMVVVVVAVAVDAGIGGLQGCVVRDYLGSVWIWMS